MDQPAQRLLPGSRVSLRLPFPEVTPGLRPRAGLLGGLAVLSLLVVALTPLLLFLLCKRGRGRFSRADLRPSASWAKAIGAGRCGQGLVQGISISTALPQSPRGDSTPNLSMGSPGSGGAPSLGSHLALPLAN